MKNLIIKFIRMYQLMPLSSHKNCRFIPTCSNYMIDAINIHGTLKGLKLGIKRILRCRPGGKYGYDPVSED